MFSLLNVYLAAIGIAAVFSIGLVQAADLTGAGSSFVYPVLSRWAADYTNKTGHRINYQSIGSGAGIAQIKAGTVDFGASDKPLKPAELEEAGLVQFPVVIGGVVPVVNIPGIEPGGLRLTGVLIADIFLGKVTRWNDPAIVEVNPGIELTDKPITVVHRSDGSGTTFNWVNYLSKVSEEWKANVGEGTSVNWPAGIGGKGNEGVSAYVNQVRYSIGYVELAYALQNRMTYTRVKNRAGNFITPGLESFHAAAQSADWTREPDFYEIITNAPGEKSWPIAASVFIMMHRRPKNAERSATALDFFRYALEEGQPAARALQYVPLPGNLVTQIEEYWAKRIR